MTPGEPNAAEIRARVDAMAPRVHEGGSINTQHVAMEQTLRERHGHPSYIADLDGPGRFRPSADLGGIRTVYLAARYSRHQEMQGVRDVLAALVDIEVTSRWIDCHTDVVGDFTSSFTVEFLNANPEKCAPLGQHDIDDLMAADTVISFTSTDGGKGGRHVEFGMGIALGKRSIVIGPREHVFHTLAEVEWFPDWPHFVRALSHAKAVSA